MQRRRPRPRPRVPYLHIMEGIVDGQAMDSCFYCALLYPAEATGADTQDDCPLCGGRMRYRPAAMMSDADLGARVREHRDAYVQATDTGERRQRLIALLTLLHDYAPAALAMLADTGGPTLDALRRDFEALYAGGPPAPPP